MAIVEAADERLRTLIAENVDGDCPGFLFDEIGGGRLEVGGDRCVVGGDRCEIVGGQPEIGR